MDSKESFIYLMPPPPASAGEVRSGVDRYLYLIGKSAMVNYRPVVDRVTYPVEAAKSEQSLGSGSAEPAEVVESKFKRRAGLPLSLSLILGYALKVYRLQSDLRRLPRRDRRLIHVNHVGCEIETIAARLAGFKKVVATVHNLPGEEPAAQHFVRRMIERLSFACADHFICVSEATYEAWHERLKLDRRRVSVIYNGMDVPDFKDFNRDAYRSRLLPGCEGKLWIGLCARLHPMKGHGVLLEAFAALKQRSGAEDTILVLAGDGPIAAELKAKCKALGISEWVHFLGFREDVLEFARAIDVNVLPSVFSETLGYSLIEAMFAERPSVVSDVGGMKELMRASGGGQVVPAWDASALSDKLLDYIQNPEKAQEAGRAAGVFARAELNSVRMAEQTKSVYSRVLASKRHLKKGKSASCV